MHSFDALDRPDLIYDGPHPTSPGWHVWSELGTDNIIRQRVYDGPDLPPWLDEFPKDILREVERDPLTWLERAKMHGAKTQEEQTTILNRIYYVRACRLMLERKRDELAAQPLAEPGKTDPQRAQDGTKVVTEINYDQTAPTDRQPAPQPAATRPDGPVRITTATATLNGTESASVSIREDKNGATVEVKRVNGGRLGRPDDIPDDVWEEARARLRSGREWRIMHKLYDRTLTQHFLETVLGDPERGIRDMVADVLIMQRCYEIMDARQRQRETRPKAPERPKALADDPEPLPAPSIAEAEPAPERQLTGVEQLLAARKNRPQRDLPTGRDRDR